jgi:hypothetical protein
MAGIFHGNLTCGPDLSQGGDYIVLIRSTFPVSIVRIHPPACITRIERQVHDHLF